MKKGKSEMLTTLEVAAHYGIAYQTVMAWIYEGRFPNAQKEETPRGAYYLIPSTDLADVQPRQRGRKPKAQEEEQGTKARKKAKKRSDQ